MTAIIGIGNSMVEGMGAAGFAHAPGVGWPAQLQTLIGDPGTTRYVANYGISGQTAPQIAARMDCPQYRAVFTAGAAVGGVHPLTLTAGPSLLFSLVNRSRAGTLGGVTGTLNWVQASGTYTFTPASGAVPVDQPLTFSPGPSDPTATWVFDVGRNNPGQLGWTMGALDAMIRILTGPHYLVLGTLHAQDGLEAAAVDATNAALAAVFGARFINPNTFIVTSDYADNLHCNDAGYGKYAQAINQKLTTLGI